MLSLWKRNAMTYTFNLNNPKEGVSSIRLIVSQDGKKYRRQIGTSIETKLYNGKASSMRAKFKDASVYEKLSTISKRLEEVKKDSMTAAEVEAAIDYALSGEKNPTMAKHPGAPSLWEFFDEWSSRDVPSKHYRRNAYLRVKDMMGDSEDWADINYNYYLLFLSKMDAAKRSLNYRSTIVAKLRTMMKEGYDRGYHNNEVWRKFSAPYETADAIALTKEEVDTLWKLKLTNLYERKARDLFILGCYTAARFQTYSRLTEDNITDGKIRFIQEKTGGGVVIPCSPKVKQILKRWGGAAPVMAQQMFNRYIKDVCKAAGMDSMVESHTTKGGKIVISNKPKYKMVSAHTARRTGATLLYKSGVPIRICRYLTGHHDDSTFMKYIKISADEAAEIMAENPFFK